MSWASTAPATDFGAAQLESTPAIRLDTSGRAGWRVLDDRSAYGKIRDTLGSSGALVLAQLQARPVSAVGTQLQAQLIAEILRSMSSSMRANDPMPDDLVDITFEQKAHETRRIRAKVVRPSGVRRALIVDEDVV